MEELFQFLGRWRELFFWKVVFVVLIIIANCLWWSAMLFGRWHKGKLYLFKKPPTSKKGVT